MKLRKSIWSPPYIATGTEGDVFQDPLDPDFIQLFDEVDGEIYPYFKAYGYDEILKALGLD